MRFSCGGLQLADRLKGIMTVLFCIYFVYYLCFFEPRRFSCGGLADRLKGIMSLLILGMVTSRSVFIHMPHPVVLEDYLNPGAIDWRIHGMPLLRVQNSSSSSSSSCRSAAACEVHSPGGGGGGGSGSSGGGEGASAGGGARQDRGEGEGGGGGGAGGGGGILNLDSGQLDLVYMRDNELEHGHLERGLARMLDRSV